MTNAKAGRPAKNQRICHACKQACSPKNGDWFFLPKNNDSQVFLCKSCERSVASASGYQRTIPGR
jgi:hypothetical protein